MMELPKKPAVRSYRTEFRGNETPISEGGIWLNGKRDGIDWADVLMRDGCVYGEVTRMMAKERRVEQQALGAGAAAGAAEGDYDDPTAVLVGNWGRDQYGRARVFSKNQTDSYFQEVEIRLRSSIKPNWCDGYEVFWRCLKADGGYAEFATVPASFAHRLPAGYADTELAPLLCAGIIGYRSLRRADLPTGGRLGIYGFGGSAHLTAQVAIAQGAEVHVMTRGERAQELALSLGAASAQGASDRPPVALDSAILFAPVGELVLPALEALDRGGTLAIAGIHLSDIPALNYQRHLFQERQVKSVTSNTRADAREFLDFADVHRLHVTSPEYPMERAAEALGDLVAGRISGAAVLVV